MLTVVLIVTFVGLLAFLRYRALVGRDGMVHYAADSRMRAWKLGTKAPIRHLRERNPHRHLVRG